MQCRRGVLIATILACSVVHHAAGASLFQDRPSINADSTQHPPQPIVREFLFGKIETVGRSGKRFFGRFGGLSDDSIIVIAKGVHERIPFGELALLSIEKESVRGKTALYMLPAGAYLGFLLFGPYDGPQGGRYLDNTMDFWEGSLYCLIGGGVIGGITYLFDSGRPGERVFTFGDDPAARLKEWDRFKTAIQGPGWQETWGISVQAAQVDTRTSRKTVQAGAFPSYEPSSFNALRSARFSFRINRWLSLGAGIVFFGEPSLRLFRSYFDPSDLSFRTYDLGEELSGAGYHALTIVRPLHGELPRWLEWDAALGLGVADINYHYTRLLQIFYPSSPMVTESSRIDIVGASVCSMVYTELRIRLWDHFSIGMLADYVYVPGKELPAVPDFSLGPKNAGNSSWGFTMAYHF